MRDSLHRRTGALSYRLCQRFALRPAGAEDTERRERESHLEKKGMEAPLEEAAQNAANILRSKEAE